MKSRMERVVEDIALRVLESVSAQMSLPLHIESLEESFRGIWPSVGSRYPMRDAMDAMLKVATAGKSEAAAESGPAGIAHSAPLSGIWDIAVADAVEAYFVSAQESFEKDEYLEGAEALTDAVRAALALIAAAKGWPHATSDDLYLSAAALATGGKFPDGEDLYILLEQSSEEGMDLCGALGACMGRPDSLRHGLYEDTHQSVQRDASLFAKTTIVIARRLAREMAATP